MNSPESINKNNLWNQIKDSLPVSAENLKSAWLVGSFSNLKSIDEDSDIDVFLVVTDDADSISVVEGKYGTATIQVGETKYQDRNIQFLTNRQPGVSINSFDNPIRLD